MDESVPDPKNERLRAFESVVSQYEAGLLRYGARILNDSNAAQDVVQEAFLKLFRCWKENLTPSASLSSWLYRVTHNTAVDYLRRESRLDLLHARHAKEQDQSVSPDRGRGFEITEDAEKVNAAVRTLSLREQQLVILKVYEEKSYKEISEITGLTVTNVGYILHYAMKRLAAELRKVKAI